MGPPWSRPARRSEEPARRTRRPTKWSPRGKRDRSNLCEAAGEPFRQIGPIFPALPFYVQTWRQLVGWVVPAVLAAGFTHARRVLPHLETEDPYFRASSLVAGNAPAAWQADATDHDLSVRHPDRAARQGAKGGETAGVRNKTAGPQLCAWCGPQKAAGSETRYRNTDWKPRSLESLAVLLRSLRAGAGRLFHRRGVNP